MRTNFFLLIYRHLLCNDALFDCWPRGEHIHIICFCPVPIAIWIDATNMQWTFMFNIVDTVNHFELLHNILFAKSFRVLLRRVSSEKHLHRRNLVQYFLFEQFAWAERCRTSSIFFQLLDKHLLRERGVVGVSQEEEQPIVCG